MGPWLRPKAPTHQPLELAGREGGREKEGEEKAGGASWGPPSISVASEGLACLPRRLTDSAPRAGSAC